MNTWSDGVVESWSGGSIRIKAVFQYSNIPIPRLRLCLTLCALLYALCTSAAAQQDAKIPRLGYLTGASLSAIEARKEGFRQGLRELGYEEGRNIFIDWRSSEGKTDRNSALAADLVRLKVDMIVTGGSGDTRAAKKATATIPIVMAGDGDPVGNGFVASLARPGGNITGLATLRPEISGKGLELLKEIVPRLSRLAVFVSSSSSDYAQVSKEIELAAGPFGMKPQFVDIRDRKDVEAAFRTARRDRADAVRGTVCEFSATTDCRTRGKEPARGDIRKSRICGSGRSCELRRERGGLVPPGRRLCGQNSKRRETRRSACGAAHEV
jgi:hypothetical protein